MGKLRTIKGPVAWMARNPVAANLVMLLCLIGGFMMLQHAQKEVFPDVQEDLVSIQVSYPGASPEEVEQSIVLAIESEISGLDGVKEITAKANEGMAVVTAEVNAGEDLDRFAQEIKSAVDRIRTFPENAEEPEIAVVSRQRSVLDLQLYGDVEPIVLREFAEETRDRMLQDPDITQVELLGELPLEISIEIPQAQLRRYGLTLEQVASILKGASVEMPGGGIKTSEGEILVRMKERRDYGRQFGLTPIINTPDGSQVLLEDIAIIKDEFEEVDRFSFFDGHPAIGITVYRIGDQSPLEIAAACRRITEELNARFPAEVKLCVQRDRSEIFEQRVELLLRNAAIGLVLVLFSLGLFLELRLAFWVMMGIPISFMGSLLFLPLYDVSINMISMFAYIIALGIVVDDAIVIGENIYFHHEKGMPFLDAAIQGARELATPVTFSILTNIATFMPLYFIPGMMGKLFKMIPVVVITVFLISLFESIFVLPAHLGHHKERQRRGFNRYLHSAQQSFGKGFVRLVNRVYGPFLAFWLHRRYVVLVFAFALLAITLSWPLSGRMGFSLFPQVESDRSRADLEMPYGTAVEKTTEIIAHIQQAAAEVVEEGGHPELSEGIFSMIGMGGSHAGYVEVYLADAEVRDEIMSTAEFTDKWREKAGAVIGAENLSFVADFGGPGHGAALTVELSHRDVDVLDKAGQELAAALAQFPACKDINDGFQPGKEQIDFVVKPEGKSLGLTASDVARQVRSAFYGAEAIRQQRSRNEIKIMVRRPKAERISEYDLDNFILMTPRGLEVPLREVVEATRGRAYTVINRRNGRRVIQVEADVTPKSRALEIQNALMTDELPQLMKHYPGLTYTFEGHQADMRESMASLKTGFILALMAIFAMLAIPFKSYAQPLIVMVSIPFGIIGALFGHLLMGFDLSVVSMFGIVALSGVVVNDALVLIDAANRFRREGKGAFESVHGAALQRFRPILLTTLTTFCGLAPMIFETSRQARFLIPMALSLGFGIVFATAITLLLVPSLYLIIEDFTALWQRRGAAPRPGCEESN